MVLAIIHLRVCFWWLAMVILWEGPRWFLAWPSRVCKAILKPADLPGPSLVDHYRFRGDVPVEHLCTVVQKSKAFRDLEKPIFDLDVKHLVRAQLFRYRTWQLVLDKHDFSEKRKSTNLTAKNVCQAGKYRFSGKCKAISALLQWVLHSQDSGVSQSRQLAHPFLHHLPNQLSVALLKPDGKRFFQSLIRQTCREERAPKQTPRQPVW